MIEPEFLTTYSQLIYRASQNYRALRSSGNGARSDGDVCATNRAWRTGKITGKDWRAINRNVFNPSQVQEIKLYLRRCETNGAEVKLEVDVVCSDGLATTERTGW